VSTVVGIDLGGTKVATAVLRDVPADRGSLRNATLEEHGQEPTDLSDGDKLVDQLVSVAQQAAGDGQLDAVGIGVPSIVEFATGRVKASANIPLANLPLRQVLGERLGVPVFVDNDATVAALAEAHNEQLELVAHNLVMITLGTGIGAGIVISGRIFRGATGGAGEIGHTLIGLPADGDFPPAGEDFPQPGSLEYMAAGHALDRLTLACAKEHPDSRLGRALAAGEQPRGKDAVAAARAGDAGAEEIVRRWAHAIGIGIANAINTFDPDEVVIGGGAAAAGDMFLATATQFAHGYTMKGLRGHARVRLARFGPKAGVLGACLLAAQELQGAGL
jgi:glucokinase